MAEANVEAELPWQERLDTIVDVMRELSRQTDPQEMVRAYGERIRRLQRIDGFVSLTRRGLAPPRFRIARSTTWDRELDPWREREKLPVLEGGLFGELVHRDQPVIIDELSVPPADPAAPYVQGMRSLFAIPVFDKGEALNVVLMLKRRPAGFERARLAEMVWTTNLLGRATHNLVLSRELADANAALDAEMAIVAEIQRALLPPAIPKICGLEVAVVCRQARRAGGDYYDFFSLPDGRWGLLVADVSGHGSPAAVVMAITHSLAHTYAGPASPPSRLLAHLNKSLANVYGERTGAFVTAFYAVWDPASRTLTHARAGHPPPRLCRSGTTQVEEMSGDGGPPAGLDPRFEFEDNLVELRRGDRFLVYTDGVTEVRDPAGGFFGAERLDAVFGRTFPTPGSALEAVEDELTAFSAGRPYHDDRTMLAAVVC